MSPYTKIGKKKKDKIEAACNHDRFYHSGSCRIFHIVCADCKAELPTSYSIEKLQNRIYELERKLS